MNSIKQQEQEQ